MCVAPLKRTTYVLQARRTEKPFAVPWCGLFRQCSVAHYVGSDKISAVCVRVCEYGAEGIVRAVCPVFVAEKLSEASCGYNHAVC